MQAVSIYNTSTAAHRRRTGSTTSDVSTGTGAVSRCSQLRRSQSRRNLFRSTDFIFNFGLILSPFSHTEKAFPTNGNPNKRRTAHDLRQQNSSQVRLRRHNSGSSCTTRIAVYHIIEYISAQCSAQGWRRRFFEGGCGMYVPVLRQQLL